MSISIARRAVGRLRRLARGCGEVPERIADRRRRERNRELLATFDPIPAEVDHVPVGSDEYDRYHQEDAIRATSYGMSFLPTVLRTFDFDTVLDAGCSGGVIVREFLRRGYVPRGIDISEWSIDTHCPDLRRAGLVQVGGLDRLPYRDDSFDLVFSSDVLEHIPEETIPAVVGELVRVAKRDLFLSINLRPSSMDNKYHCTLRPRAWWEERFREAGAVPRRELVDRLQARTPGATNRAVLEAGPARGLIDEMDWFLDDPPYDLDGELEPWFFVFRKVERGSA